MKVTYECHITCSVEHAEAATQVARELHWKTSEIARDPVLGNATYFYLTTHSREEYLDADPDRRTDSLADTQIYQRMKAAVLRLTQLGVPVIREKIEAIVFDTKTGYSFDGNS